MCLAKIFLLAAWCAVSTATAAPADDLRGMVLCGYQGWFRAEGDGSENGWKHYAMGGKFEPGHSHIEIWPEMAEFGENERFKTPFKHADGSAAEVFSSVVPETVQRHFEWMRDYGIDGVFLQRFASETGNLRLREPLDQVMRNCRESAAKTDRRWALMYDLSGLRAGQATLVIEDWKRLIAEKTLVLQKQDRSYLRIGGKPLVALWGMGFTDRATSLDEWQMLLEFFRSEAADGGCAIMLGVPYHWRTLDRDCIPDPRIHDLMRLADVVSPWAVGRLATPEDAFARVDAVLKPDLAWCEKEGLGYLPVAFPGFSWQNLQKGRGIEAKFDQIPRRGGRFLWSQALAAREAGAEALYVAMFDELDEATAIFKTTQDPPVGASRFLAEPGLPSDHYLRLAGNIGKLLRGEIPADAEVPGP